MARIELEPEDKRRLQEVFADTFDRYQLEETVSRLFKKLANSINFSAPLTRVVFDVVEKSNAYGVLDQIFVDLVAQVPFRPDLLEVQMVLATREGWDASLTHGMNRDSLERLLGKGNAFVNAQALGSLMARVPRQVCQVKTPGNNGTGFLIGPDLVLTNSHVIGTSAEIAVRFDYFGENQGGEWIEIDRDWTIVRSPSSSADETEPFGQPDAKELDYAVLKLSKAPGKDSGEAGERKWVDLSEAPPYPEKLDAAVIVGFPAADDDDAKQMPLSVSFGARAFDAMNANQTRVAYKVDTKPGSSGSPVFSSKLRPVVLHHSGGADKKGADPQTGFGENNRGIPLKTIFESFPEDLRKLLKKP